MGQKQIGSLLVGDGEVLVSSKGRSKSETESLEVLA